MRYLNRVILINSANVKYAEISLDGNVHFIGTQGVGKSTLLRAILFFYNADKLKLGIEKGKKTFDEYYFPFGNSYIVYEVVRETGSYTIMAFKSQGRVCYRFINSEYRQEFFVDEEGKVRVWDGIREKLGKKTGYSKKIDRYEEFRDILYGNNTGLEKEFRKYSLIESRMYQNLPRTIQNVFLNSKLDAEFIKQTIIMSINETEVKIELSQYLLHLKDFDTQLTDISKWTETNKTGEIPVRKMAETIAQKHGAIQSLNREKKETAIQLFIAYEAAITEAPSLEKNIGLQEIQLQIAQQKANELKDKFQARKDELQKRINILDNDLKRIKQKVEYYDNINIHNLIQRVSKKDFYETERERLTDEKTLLNARFTEINNRYEALMQQQQNAYSAWENRHHASRNKLREAFLKFKNEAADQKNEAITAIRLQHNAELEVARNRIAQAKDNIHELKLKKQKIQLQRYYEQDIENLREELNSLNQKIKTYEVDIADYKKQAATLQQQHELEHEKMMAGYERRLEKLWEENKIFASAIETIDTKLQKNKDSLYAWLCTNLPGWENNIGKLIDEEQVLFQSDLSPQLADVTVDSFYGLKLNVEDIEKTVKTLADYEREKGEWLLKIEGNKALVNKLVEERDNETEKLKTRFQQKVKELNNTRRQMEYEHQRAKGQVQTNEVKRADLVRKAEQERADLLQQTEAEKDAAYELLTQDEKNLKDIEDTLQKQTDQKEKEHNRRIKEEEKELREKEAGYDRELEAKQQETQDRIAQIQQQQNAALQNDGADVQRLTDIDRELASIKRELDFINENIGKVAIYYEDKRELIDTADSLKTEKRLKESQAENEKDKFNLQKQKLDQEIAQFHATITDLNKRLDGLNEGLDKFTSFKKTDHYAQIAEYECAQQVDKSSALGLAALIELLNSKIYTIIDRYNDLQAAINKFIGNFSADNIFGFKTQLPDREAYNSFAEMLYEFLEENKIAQFEKRVNERFATLIRQIGKETNELTSKSGEIQKVISEINHDFEERNFAGVIKSIRLQLSESKNKIVTLLQEIQKFNNESAMALGMMNLFSTGDNEGQNKKAIALLKEFAKEINEKKEKEVGLQDSFELQFRIVENENDSGWVEKLSNVGSEGTDILVKAMINIMLLNVFKDSASRKFKDFRLHCMMDEIGKLHPNNVKGILKFANDRNILLINSSPTSFNATDYRYTYLLSKDNKHVTTIKRLIKKGAE